MARAGAGARLAFWNTAAVGRGGLGACCCGAAAGAKMAEGGGGWMMGGGGGTGGEDPGTECTIFLLV